MSIASGDRFGEHTPSTGSLNLSHERFAVVYRVTGTEDDARTRAEEIRFEQTVEFPAALVPPGDILDQVVGRVEALRPIDSGRWEVTISYAVETAGPDLPQLLNVVFGNSSIKPGIRVEALHFPAGMLQSFKGPRFGRAGLRERLGVPERPLLCTALKPMGLSVEGLAQLAYQCALGGIDLVKDDHGLADQPFAPYRERVQACVEAVERANRETGQTSLYVPNVTAPADQIVDKALWAKKVGAGGLLISPGLTGLDTMRRLADDDRIGLPILSHPAFQGSFVTSPDSGISHFALFGQIARLAGADATIYPNYGGRFSFSQDECRQIVAGTSVAMGALKEIFPAPGGGMNLARVPEMLNIYGRDVIFLIGGGLHSHGPNLVENCRYFRHMIEAM